MSSVWCLDPSSRTRGNGTCRVLAVVLSLAGFTGIAGAQMVRARPDASSAAELLRAPGEDPYAEPVDWQRLPPWQQTSFFGVRSQGQFFVYVIDCSGSMGDELRLARAKAELMRSVQALSWPQRFLVIYFNDRAWPMCDGMPLTASTDSKARLRSWSQQIDADGETDPRGALRMALGMRPDAVYLLTDGEFPEGTAAAIAPLNPRRIPVHCIGVSQVADFVQLQAIARESGGTCVQRP